MIHPQSFNDFTVQLLTRDLALKHANDISRMLNLIPFVDYKPEDVLKESKGERQFYGKWEHSLIVFDDDKPIAVIIAYERKKEGNEQYPENTIYINELTVDENHQRNGIATNLLKSFFAYNNQLGFKYLNGNINYSIQTSSSDKNQHVIDLYKSFGFIQRTTKEYENRTDIVMGLKIN
jgi:ribosomal protein S18 acetylase RimI-like enzyme